METLDVWELIKIDKFEKAIEIADLEYEKTKNISPLRNKIYALLHLKRYQEVISLSEFLIKARNGETQSDFISLGIGVWLAGNRTRAIEIWKNAQDCLYKDAAGGVEVQVFLYFAAIKTSQMELKLASKKSIKKLLKSKKNINWPGPIGLFLLDEITEVSMISRIPDISGIRERQLTQAHFASALKRLEIGDKDGYYKALLSCVSYGNAAYLSQMYYLAKAELDMDSQPGASMQRER